MAALGVLAPPATRPGECVCPCPVLSGAGGGRRGHAPLWVPPWGLAWGLGHVGPAGRSLQALSWASAGRGAPGRLPLLSLGVSSWEGSWGRGGRVFLVLRGRWRPGSGGSSASCVWVVVGSPLSPGLHGGGLTGPVPWLPGQCLQPELLLIRWGAASLAPGLPGCPLRPCPRPAVPVAQHCPRTGAPRVSAPASPSAHPASRALGDSGATLSFPHCSSPGPRLPRGGRDLLSPELCLASAGAAGWSPGRDRVEPSSEGSARSSSGRRLPPSRGLRPQPGRSQCW